MKSGKTFFDVTPSLNDILAQKGLPAYKACLLGENNRKSVLTKDDVIAIRKLADGNNISASKIISALNLNASRGAVNGVVTRRTWNHI